MSANAIAAAQRMITGLRALSPEQYVAHLNKSIHAEAVSVLQQAQYYGFETAYSQQITREDFDKTYAAFRKAGEENPQACLAQEASYIRALYKNPDPIGRQFFSEVKSARIKMAPHIAKRMHVPAAECERILHALGDTTRACGPNLTAAEKDYIAARRLPIAHSLKTGAYSSKPEEAPDTSSWAQRMLKEELPFGNSRN